VVGDREAGDEERRMCRRRIGQQASLYGCGVMNLH
jgi:hypothetical protein